MGLRDIFRRQAPPAAPRAEPVLAVPPRAPRAGRAWLAAQPSRLLADLPAGAAATPNREIRQSLAALRARSRWLAQNDGYSKGFLRLLRRNVVGPHGFALKMGARNDRGDGFDRVANTRIEEAWAEWAEVGSCDVTGRLSLTDLCQLAITCAARDGEALVRMVRGEEHNRFGFALQVLDPNRLDENLGTSAAGQVVGGMRLAAGHVIRQGVEINAWGRPAAYWIRTALDNDDVISVGSRRYVRVPADDVLHLFVADWPDGQVRGVPWLDAAIRSLAMLDGYQESELVAARVGASKMGFYKQADAEDIDAELQADGNLVQEAEAGAFELLPKGVEVQTFDPAHPNAAFKDFVSAVLRSAAAGTGFSYTAVANHAEDLSYSALRGITLEDREEYRTLQGWMLRNLVRRAFRAWLAESLLHGALGNLPPGKFRKFDAPRFVGRGWSWVDPRNEVDAAKGAVELGLRSRTQMAAEQGGDFEQTLAELKAEAAAMEGLPRPAAAPAAPQPQETAK